MIKPSVLFGAWLCALLLLPAFLDAQTQSTADRMDALLDSQAVSWETATVFILNEMDIRFGSAGAFEYCRNQQWIPRDTYPREPITMQGLSLLIMHAFDFPGGFMYRLTRNSRYAFKELQAKDILPPGSDPSFYPSGQDFLYVIHRALEEKGNIDE